MNPERPKHEFPYLSLCLRTRQRPLLLGFGLGPLLPEAKKICLGCGATTRGPRLCPSCGREVSGVIPPVADLWHFMRHARVSDNHAQQTFLGALVVCGVRNESGTVAITEISSSRSRVAVRVSESARKNVSAA